MINLVDRINELLSQKGWTGYELSNQTGISISTIYDWNRTGSTPSLANIVKICEALNITLGQFFCGTEVYPLTKDENKILQEWFVLSDFEKGAIKHMIETFKVLKQSK